MKEYQKLLVPNEEIKFDLDILRIMYCDGASPDFCSSIRSCVQCLFDYDNMAEFIKWLKEDKSRYIIKAGGVE